MPVIPIESAEQYEKAISVLTEVGGTYQGIGPADAAKLLVSERQYRALLAARVVSETNEAKGTGRGSKANSTK